MGHKNSTGVLIILIMLVSSLLIIGCAKPDPRVTVAELMLAIEEGDVSKAAQYTTPRFEESWMGVMDEIINLGNAGQDRLPPVSEVVKRIEYEINGDEARAWTYRPGGEFVLIKQSGKWVIDWFDCSVSPEVIKNSRGRM